MPSVTLTENVTIAGVRISFQITRDVPGVIGQQVTLDPATAGQLTTRTDNDTGTLTVATGHDIVNSTGGYTLFWEGGIRRAMNTVITSNTVALDGGAGDNLPVVNTNCTLGVQVTLNTDFDGNTVAMFGASAQRRGSVEFQQEDGTSILPLDFGLSGTDGEGYAWWDDGPEANPLINTVVGQCVVANGSSNSAGNTVRVGVQYDSEV